MIIKQLIGLIVGGTIALGYARFNLNLVDRANPQFMDVFSLFTRFKEAFLLNLLKDIFVILWTLLLFIPGLIASLSYSMAYYILLENPEMSALEAIKASKDLMKGYKFKLFCLDLSFIGWQLLSTLTFGLGDLVLRPYIEAARAVFYREIKDKKYSNIYENSDGENVRDEE